MPSIKEMNMKRVLVMCETSGLLYGDLVTRNHQEVTLANCRRIYSYSGACSIDQLAVEGSKDPHNCIITCPVDRYIVLDAIEIITMTNKSWHNLNRIRSWKAIGDKQQEMKRLKKLLQKVFIKLNNAHNEVANRNAHTLSEIATIKSNKKQENG